MNETTKNNLRVIGKYILSALLLLAYASFYGVGRVAGWIVVGCTGACQWLSKAAKAVG